MNVVWRRTLIISTSSPREQYELACRINRLLPAMLGTEPAEVARLASFGIDPQIAWKALKSNFFDGYYQRTYVWLNGGREFDFNAMTSPF